MTHTKPRSALSRAIGLMATAGGGLWLIAFGSIFLYPLVGNVGHLPLAFVGMAAAAALLAASVAALCAEVVPSGVQRVIVYLALTSTSVATWSALLILAVVGDIDLAWGLLDPEALSFDGYAAIMAAMALASVAASRKRRSAAWWAAVVGASGQAAVQILLDVWPSALGSTQPLSALFPIPILLFGAGWCAIGLERIAQDSPASDAVSAAA